MTGGAGSGPFEFSDTIAATATVPGRGALAVVRLSGPQAHDIARAVAERWPEAPRVATLTTIRRSLKLSLGYNITVGALAIA